jgi:hypothetical protein
MIILCCLNLLDPENLRPILEIYIFPGTLVCHNPWLPWYSEQSGFVGGDPKIQ